MSDVTERAAALLAFQDYGVSRREELGIPDSAVADLTRRALKG